jgi:hypothetical protein
MEQMGFDRKKFPVVKEQHAQNDANDQGKKKPDTKYECWVRYKAQGQDRYSS